MGWKDSSNQVRLSLFLIFELFLRLPHLIEFSRSFFIYTRFLQIPLPSNHFYDSVFTGNVIFALTTWFNRIWALKVKVMIHFLFKFWFCFISIHPIFSYLRWHLRLHKRFILPHVMLLTCKLSRGQDTEKNSTHFCSHNS